MLALLNSHVIGLSQPLRVLTLTDRGILCHFGSRRGGFPTCLVHAVSPVGVSLFWLVALFLLLVMASPSRAVPDVSLEDIVIEDVATLLADITKQTEMEVQNKGIIETLLAADMVGLLKEHPLLRQLAAEMQDGSKRRRLESQRRPVTPSVSLPGVLGPKRRSSFSGLVLSGSGFGGGG